MTLIYFNTETKEQVEYEVGDLEEGEKALLEDGQDPEHWRLLNPPEIEEDEYNDHLGI